MAGTRCVYIVCLDGWSWSSSGSGSVPKPRAVLCCADALAGCARALRVRVCFKRVRSVCVCVRVCFKCLPAARPAVASLQPPAPPSHRYNQPTRHRPARRWPGLPSSRRRPSRSPACRSGTPTGSARRAPGATPSRPSPRTRTCATRRRRGVRVGDAARCCGVRACVLGAMQRSRWHARPSGSPPLARPPALGVSCFSRTPAAPGDPLRGGRVAARSCSSTLVLKSSHVAMLPCCTSRALQHASCCSAAATHSAPVSAPSTSVPSGRNSAHSSARASDSRFEYLRSGRRTPSCDYSYP